MNLLLFVMALVASFVVVRIGAIAFQLTGLEWSLAKFQSLSCFTGTGFTTREAELITTSPQRRRIAAVLMVLGNAGLIALIATFANSIDPNGIAVGIKIPFLSVELPPTLLAAINLVVIVAAIYVTFRVFTRTKIARRITDYLRARVIRREMVVPVSFEELALVTGGYGVLRIEVGKDSAILGKTILESSLRGRDITVLAMVRAGETMANPGADTKIALNDQLICFGKSDNIRALTPAGAVQPEKEEDAG